MAERVLHAAVAPVGSLRPFGLVPCRLLPPAADQAADQRRVGGLLRRHQEGGRPNLDQLQEARAPPRPTTADAVAVQHVAGALCGTQAFPVALACFFLPEVHR